MLQISHHLFNLFLASWKLKNCRLLGDLSRAVSRRHFLLTYFRQTYWRQRVWINFGDVNRPEIGNRSFHNAGGELDEVLYGPDSVSPKLYAIVLCCRQEMARKAFFVQQETKSRISFSDINCRRNGPGSCSFPIFWQHPFWCKPMFGNRGKNASLSGNIFCRSNESVCPTSSTSRQWFIVRIEERQTILHRQ